MKLAPLPEVEEARVHMAPLLDVIFLVLAAFIQASVLLTQPIGVAVALPHADTGSAAAGELIRIAIDRDGDLFLDGRPIAAPALGQALRAAAGSADGAVVGAVAGVYVRADREAPVAALVAVLDLARVAGIDDLTVATESATESVPGPERR